MGVVKLRGLVIGELQKGEGSKRLVVLAKGIGRVILSAKGAQNTKSKLLAVTQLFSYCDFLVYEGKGFLSLTQGELIAPFYGLRMDMERLAEAVYIAELVERTCPLGMEQDETLLLLLTTLTALEKGALAPKLVSRIFEIKYLQISGLLSPDGCMHCGEVSSPLYFDVGSGAFLCQKHKEGNSVMLLRATEKAIAYVMEQEGRALFRFQLSEEALAQLDGILREYIALHMNLRLKSREFAKGL